MDNVIPINSKNYVKSGSTEENSNADEKYETTGESEFSREATQPLDEVLSERHYLLGGVHSYQRQNLKNEGNHFSGIPPKDFIRSDERIFEDVSEGLMKSRRVDPSNISVKVASGVVTLEGVVPQRVMKKLAGAIAEKISGVKSVKNLVKIEAFGKPLVDNRTGLN